MADKVEYLLDEAFILNQSYDHASAMRLCEEAVKLDA
jgi:hypothetical protein